MRLPVSHALPLYAALLLGGCLFGGGDRPEAVAPAGKGPAADYPVTIGEPFNLEGVTYKPADTMNYDAVGHAALDPDAGPGVTAAHKTLPFPSYVEVTSLTSGRTALVRVERRGPMLNDRLIALSAGAAAQLGLTDENAPVRVRRVNPPEAERALLRSGQQAPLRMDTPKSLLVVLMRKLDPLAPAPGPVAVAPSPEPSTAAPVPEEGLPAVARPAPRGSLVVQAGAFSTRERADSVAAPLGAQVSRPGRYWVVRMGPFATARAADEALAKAKAAGYSDARIQRAD